MTVIVTMAGAGSRFRMQGYEVPKHMIRARGKTLFEWSMESLRYFFDQHFIFACLAEHDADWIERLAVEMGIKEVSVVPRECISSGQAQTAHDVLSLAADREEVWIYNIDTYIERGISPGDMNGCQGCVHVFESNNPGMSFVRYEDNGRVAELAEKRAISNWATVGIYGFTTADLYHQLYESGYQQGRVQEVSGERFVAPMYQLLLTSGGMIAAPKLDISAVHILGTPADVLAFDPSARPPYGS